MKFNINSEVKVKLTKYGLGTLANLPGKPSHLETDTDGWSTWQLWYLMKVFGPFINMGSPLLFETDIEIINET